jgi:hypothetical protein
MITHTHIFYTDRLNGWCEQHRDDEGNQVGGAFYHYRKADAIKSAKGMDAAIHVFGKNGLIQRII